MARKADPTGKSKGDGKHVRDHEWMLRTQAYRHLSCPGRCLLTELRRIYNGSNNGDIYLSVRDAGELLGVNKDTATKAFRELEEKGFIHCNQGGGFAWKRGVASTWILEEFAYDDNLPTKSFMRWQHPEWRSESDDLPADISHLKRIKEARQKKQITVPPGRHTVRQGRHTVRQGRQWGVKSGQSVCHTDSFGPKRSFTVCPAGHI